MKLKLKLLIFFYFSTLGILLPFLPLLLKTRGLDSSQIGILLAIGPFISMLVQSPWGYLSDRLQTVRKIIIIQITAAFLLSLFLFNLHSFYSLIPVMILFYAFAWPPIPLLDCLMLATVKETEDSYGSYRLYGSIGFALTALMAGAILSVVGIERVNYLYQGILLISLLMAFLVHDVQSSRKPTSPLKLRKLITRPVLLIFLLVIALISMTNKANESFMGIFISEIGGAESEVGWAWTVGTLSEVPIFAMSGLLLARFNELTLLALAAAIYSIRWLLFATTSDPNIIILVQLLHGLTYGLFYLSAVSYVSKIVPPELLATGQGLFYTFAGGVAGVTGSLIGGFILDGFGARVMYYSSSLLALLSAAAFVVMALKHRERTEIQRVN